MGEVRVAVRLTNAVDEGMVRRGMLTPDQVRTYQADALVDTGAVRTVIPPQVARGSLILGDEVLMGQTVLEKLDLFVDSRGRRLVPNPAHPDQSITKVKLAASEVA